VALNEDCKVLQRRLPILSRIRSEPQSIGHGYPPRVSLETVCILVYRGCARCFPESDELRGQ
jgi:hypothetical protein